MCSSEPLENNDAHKPDRLMEPRLEQGALADLHPHAAALLSPMGRAVMMLCEAGECEAQQWIEHAGEALWLWIASVLGSRYGGGHPHAAGVWIALYEVLPDATAWAMQAAAVKGHGGGGTAAKVLTQTRLSSRDDLPPGLSPAGGEPMDRLCTSEQLIALGAGGDYRAWRNGVGLGGFVRASRVVSGVRGPRVLLMQVDAGLGAPISLGLAASGLEVCSPFVKAAYERCVGRAMARQTAVLSRLNETQRALVPLLIAGHTEKYISETTNRSLHSIHDYVKGIYRTLEITSRLDLVRRWHGLAEVDGQSPR